MLLEDQVVIPLSIDCQLIIRIILSTQFYLFSSIDAGEAVSTLTSEVTPTSIHRTPSLSRQAFLHNEVHGGDVVPAGN